MNIPGWGMGKEEHSRPCCPRGSLGDVCRCPACAWTSLENPFILLHTARWDRKERGVCCLINNLFLILAGGNTKPWDSKYSSQSGGRARFWFGEVGDADIWDITGCPFWRFHPQNCSVQSSDRVGHLSFVHSKHHPQFAGNLF